MGMITYVVGYKPADEIWKKMKQVWNACEDIGVQIPEEVLTYFAGECPGDKPGMDVDISDATREYLADARQGFEVDVEKLPQGVRYIRFINDY